MGVQEICVVNQFTNYPWHAYRLHTANVGTLTVSGDVTIAGTIREATLGSGVRVQSGSFASDLQGNVTAAGFVLAPYVATNALVAPAWKGQLEGAAAASVQGVDVLFAGNVGLGTQAPSNFQLDLSTDDARKLTSTTWFTASDQRVKRNVQPADLDECLRAVRSLPLRRFEWAPEVSAADRACVGWIAQEVQQVFPKAVRASPGFGHADFLSLDVDQLYKATYGAVQRLAEKVEALERGMREAVARLENLERR